MKKSGILFIVLLIGIFGCIRTKNGSHKVEVSDNKQFPYLISNGKLGTITIGDRIDSTLKYLQNRFKVEKDSISSCEGCTTFTLVFRIFTNESNQYLFSIEPGWEENNKNKVFRIITTSGLFETDKAIKVGMTVSDIKKAYDILQVSVEGELGIHLIVKDFNGSFGIELLKTDDWGRINKTTIPDSLRITEIIIV